MHSSGRGQCFRTQSSPVAALVRNADHPTTWLPVRKVRRATFFAAIDGQLSPRVPAAERDTGCAVELTEVTAQGRQWWTLGLEATGRHEELPGLIEATVSLMFNQPLPPDLELSTADCSSYYGWLRNQRAPAEATTEKDEHAVPPPRE
jgi:hypothetical protein